MADLLLNLIDLAYDDAEENNVNRRRRRCNILMNKNILQHFAGIEEVP